MKIIDGDKAITDNRSDIEKLEAAGFDRKTSFRNKKNEPR